MGRIIDKSSFQNGPPARKRQPEICVTSTSLYENSGLDLLVTSQKYEIASIYEKHPTICPQAIFPVVQVAALSLLISGSTSQDAPARQPERLQNLEC
jgi:hypothetical protein